MIKKMNSELAKLIYDLDGNESLAFNVYNVRKNLSPGGFEYYISFFFRKKLGYKTKIPTGIFSSDGGIDITGIRLNKDGIKEYCIIQCKKHSSKAFGINDLRSFVGGIFHHLHNFPTTKAYFITTSVYTQPAIHFAEKEGICIKDYYNITNIYNRYPLSEFEKDIKKELPGKYKLIFNKGKDIKEVRSQGKLFLSEEDELLKTLKEIRYNIMKKNHVYESKLITDDKILEYLSRKRPHNLDALKSSLYEGEFEKEEINNTLIHANEYIKGMLIYS